MRLAVAGAVLAAIALAWALWRRPPRRLGRMDLGAIGISGPAVVQFATRSCAPCKASAPRLRAVATDARVPFEEIDVGERPEVARACGIRTVPTVAVTGAGGRVIEVWTGVPEDRAIAEAATRGRATAGSGRGARSP